MYIAYETGCMNLYVPFSMFNHTCAGSGINYNGVDKNGKVLWDRYNGGEGWKIEIE
jgi:hypothetical protein